MPQDLYNKILGIECNGTSPNYYLLLGVDLFESDGKKIHHAGLIQIKKLREWQLHTDPEISKSVQEMLNEVSFACTTLEIAAKKEIYDRNLSQTLGINLQDNREYQILSEESELQSCPNCGCEMSKLSILCIECGYNTETGEKLQTIIGRNPLIKGQPSQEKPSLTAGQIILFPFVTIKAILCLPFVYKKSFMVLLIVTGLTTYYYSRDYTMTFPDRRMSGMFNLQWRFFPIIRQSPLWQAFFSYKHNPFLTFQVSWQNYLLTLTVLQGDQTVAHSEIEEPKKTDDELEKLVNQCAGTTVLKYANSDQKLVDHLVDHINMLLKTPDPANTAACVEILGLLAKLDRPPVSLLNYLARLMQSKVAPGSVIQAAKDAYLCLIFIDSSWQVSYASYQKTITLGAGGRILDDGKDYGSWSVKDQYFNLQFSNFKGTNNVRINPEIRFIAGKGEYSQVVLSRLRRSKTVFSATTWEARRLK